MTNQAVFLIRSIRKKQNFIKKQILKNKKKGKPMVFYGFCSRIWRRKRSKIATKPVLEGLFFRCSRSCSILIRFGFDFGCLWALPWAPKGDPKSIKFVSPTKGAPKRSPKRPQEAPRGPQEGPKRRQEVPQKAPQSPKRALKRHQENPKRPQEAPGSPQGKVD